MENKSNAVVKRDTLILDNAYLVKAGIELPKGDKAIADARANLIRANGNKGYIPQNSGADTVVQIMDYARQELDAGESAMKHVCIALASVDMSEGYTMCHDANGKPYASMLALSMDMLPSLAKSTVAGYLAVGRTIYVPAIRKRFGASSSVLLDLPPSTLDALKANLNNSETAIANATIEALRVAAKKGKVTQRLAKNIAKIVRDAHKNGTLSLLTATMVIKAASGDTPTLEIVYPKAGDTQKRTGGATANGGNAKSANSAENANSDEYNSDEYNAIKANMLEYITPVIDHDNTSIVLSPSNKSALSGLFKRALVSNDVNDSRRIIRALMEIIG